MFAYGFVRDAYLEGTCTALACGLVGWFVVLRGQVFAGDAISHVAFAGAVAAGLVGIDPSLGVVLAGLLTAAVLSASAGGAGIDDVAIGTVFSLILGLGILLVTVASTGSAGGQSAITAAHTLFGSIFGLSHAGAVTGAAICLAACAALLAIGRPLLFASVDPDVAAVHGVPVRALGVVLLALLAVISAQTVQAVGALLLLGLVAAPAGAAHRLTNRPLAGLALSAAIAVGCVWSGLALAYAVSSIPPSSAIMLLAAACYVLSLVATSRRWPRQAALG